MSGEVWEVWNAYHERERLCPEGVRVREIAHVHYACESYAGGGGVFRAGREHRWGDTDSFSYPRALCDNCDNLDNCESTLLHK